MSDVAIIMGSDSDWPIMEEAAKVLDLLGISYSADVVSAHRMPLEMVEFAQSAKAKGYKVIIAGAGGSAPLGRHRPPRRRQTRPAWTWRQTLQPLRGQGRWRRPARCRRGRRPFRASQPAY